MHIYIYIYISAILRLQDYYNSVRSLSGMYGRNLQNSSPVSITVGYASTKLSYRPHHRPFSLIDF